MTKREEFFTAIYFLVSIILILIFGFTVDERSLHCDDRAHGCSTPATELGE